MNDKLPWDNPMDPRNALHPDNPRFQRKPTIASHRLPARDGYPVDKGIKCAVDVEWLRSVCAMAKVEFREEWSPTPTHCPVTGHHHVWLGLRPGTSSSDEHIYAVSAPERCECCGWIKNP